MVQNDKLFCMTARNGNNLCKQGFRRNHIVSLIFLLFFVSYRLIFSVFSLSNKIVSSDNFRKL